MIPCVRKCFYCGGLHFIGNSWYLIGAPDRVVLLKCEEVNRMLLDPDKGKFNSQGQFASQHKLQRTKNDNLNSRKNIFQSVKTFSIKEQLNSNCLRTANGWLQFEIKFNQNAHVSNIRIANVTSKSNRIAAHQAPDCHRTPTPSKEVTSGIECFPTGAFSVWKLTS